jgi:hypothetical protein
MIPENDINLTDGAGSAIREQGDSELRSNLGTSGGVQFPDASASSPAVGADFEELPSGGESGPERDWAEGKRRLRILRAVAGAIAEGISQGAAAKSAGEDGPSVCRWIKRIEAVGITLDILLSGPADQLDAAAEALTPGYGHSGRHSCFEHVLADQAFCRKLMSLYVATMGASGQNVLRSRRTAKMATAFDCMVDEPEGQRYPELLALFRRKRYPSFLCRFLRKVTPELESKIRGPKHSQLIGLNGHRDNTIRFPDGSRAEMPAGYALVLDDMSVNQPFWCHLDGQLMFSRQGLYALDQRSKRWLGKMLVARPREAYRAEDILRFLRQLMEAYGKPEVLILERGVWHARSIRGYRLPDTVVERPAMAAEQQALLSAGVEALGIRIKYAISAHDKLIEACFNSLQDIIACKTQEFVNIGRHAGEFELGAKRLRQARAESHTPEELGFPTMSELSDRIDASLALINARLNSLGEIPNEIWARDIERRPLLTLTERDQAAFLPAKDLRKIDGGRLVIRGQTFRADFMVDLGSGYRVFAKYDPTDLARGIAVYNAETSSSNTEQYRLGEFIGWAAWEIPAPAIDATGPVRGVESRPVEDFYGVGAVDQGDTFLRRQKRRLGELQATVFSAETKPGQPPIKVSRACDGKGASIEVANQSKADRVQRSEAQRVRDETMAHVRSAESQMTPSDIEALASIDRGPQADEVSLDEFVSAFADTPPTKESHERITSPITAE